MDGFVDIHQHFLYGVDDGPRRAEDMYAMLEAAAADGITRMLATSHMTPGVKRFPKEAYDRALAEAKAYCQERGLVLTLDGGAEVLYTEQTPQFLLDEEIPVLAESDRILVEFSPDVTWEKFTEAIDKILCGGYVPVVAHVERYRCIARNAARARDFRKQKHIFYQMNCRTVIEPGGFFEKRFVRHMLDWDAIDAIATDAHNVSSRRVHMREAAELLAARYGEDKARRLTDGRVLRG